jgi:hypothetical protein
MPNSPVKIPGELKAALGTFKVQKKQCSTCIYRKDSPLDLDKLEDEVRDESTGFKAHRICHNSDNENACCRGFWNRHRDEFPGGQIAQRLGLVEFVHDDIDAETEETDA